MSRKHYIAIAKAIREANDAPGYKERNKFIVVALCDVFAQDNKNFNRAKFMEACGY